MYGNGARGKHHPEECLGNDAQSFGQGLVRKVHVLERVDDLVAQAGNDGCEQAVLVTEVGIQRALGPADPGNDAVDTDPGVALLQEHFRRRSEDALTLLDLPLTLHTFAQKTPLIDPSSRHMP
ncbi:hypothetical protein D3C75_1102010 [compost metagenome]